jgi:hypothetical protein
MCCSPFDQDTRSCKRANDQLARTGMLHDFPRLAGGQIDISAEHWHRGSCVGVG